MAQSDLAKLLNLQLGAAKPEEPKMTGQNEMLAQAIIGLAPILAGAALGGARGGAVGAQAGLTGLEAIEKGRKEKEAKAEKLKASEKERLTTAIALSKEEREQAASKRLEERQIKELGFKGRELEIKEAEAGKGSKLTSEQTQILSGFTSADKQLEEIEKNITKNQSLMGPFVGRLSGFAGYNTAAKQFDARMKLAAQDIGKALEGGKLTDADIDRYRAMLPNITDTPDVAREKSTIVRELIETKRLATVEALGAGGYNISKIKIPPNKKPLQQKIPAGTGTKEAFASDKPGFMGAEVIQNGIRYKWNESTGQYE